MDDLHRHSRRFPIRPRPGPEAPLGLAADTHAFCRPADVARTPIPGGWAWDAPACRDDWWAHRVELVAGTVADGLAAWDARHAGKGLGRRAVTLELATDAPWPDAPPRWAPTRQAVLARAGAPVSAAETIDADAAADFLAAERPAHGPDHRAALRWWLGGLHARGGVTLAITGDDGVRGVLTAVPGPGGLVRLQEAHVAARWRRRGLLRALLGAVPAGRVVVVADLGGAEAAWRALGFAPAGRLLACAAPPP
jgi:hypothetical protein